MEWEGNNEVLVKVDMLLTNKKTTKAALCWDKVAMH